MWQFEKNIVVIICAILNNEARREVEVVLLSVESAWLSIYSSYLRKLCLLQPDIRCMLWWDRRKLEFVIINHDGSLLHLRPVQSVRVFRSVHLCGFAQDRQPWQSGGRRRYKDYGPHILSQVWFGTTDFEMGYKETTNEVDAEVLGCGILTCMCIVSLTILLRSSLSYYLQLLHS